MSLIEPLKRPVSLPDPIPENKVEDRRLWLGNLDPRVTEYNVLKLVQKHGTIEKFDLLFHRSGPSAGQPRGYAFVTYSSSEDAAKAKDSLDGTLMGCKRVVVRWANSISKEELDRSKPELEIPALAGAKSDKKISRQTTIQAIEAKLKMMEHSSLDDFEVNNAPAGNLFTQQQAPLKTRQCRGRHDSRPYRRPTNYRR
ncbi:probable RNA-binding protein 18 [Periplaneta americana]|uniref:probable RNA-binding protein 18 n=1 Tax=Periplaneta americana TaxID=6978 RepID=UPI0037E71480